MHDSQSNGNQCGFRCGFLISQRSIEVSAIGSRQDRQFHACRLLADLSRFWRICLLIQGQFSGNFQANQQIQRQVVDSIESEPSWQSGGHEFDPRQLHQQNKRLKRFPKFHFSSSKANIYRLFADFVSRIDVVTRRMPGTQCEYILSDWWIHRNNQFGLSFQLLR